LDECGAASSVELHDLILEAMLTGKLRKLNHFLKEIRGGEARSFVMLFKTPAY